MLMYIMYYYDNYLMSLLIILYSLKIVHIKSRFYIFRTLNYSSI